MTEAKKKAKKFSMISLATIITIGGATIATLEFTDNRYAMAMEQEKNTLEIDILKLKNSHREAQEELFWFRKQSRKYPADESIEKKLKKQQKVVDNLEDELKDSKKILKQKGKSAGKL